MTQPTTIVNKKLPQPPWRIPLYSSAGVMSTEWVRFFQGVYDRTGGASGNIIYDTATSSQAITALEGQLLSYVANIEQQLTGVVLQLIEQVQEQYFDPTGLLTDTLQPPFDPLAPDDVPAGALIQQAIDSAPVQSVFGRKGDIIATEGDYSLDLLDDVTITAPSADDVLVYDGSEWVNGGVPAASITGTVDVAHGGTGAATHTANSVLIGNGVAPITSIAPGTAGNVLKSNGVTWASSSPLPGALPYISIVSAAGQTVFNTSPVATTANGTNTTYMNVFVNGIKKAETTHYTVTGANQITFGAGLVLSDLVEIQSFV